MERNKWKTNFARNESLPSVPELCWINSRQILHPSGLPVRQSCRGADSTGCHKALLGRWVCVYEFWLLICTIMRGIYTSPCGNGSHNLGGMAELLFSALFSLPINVHNSHYSSSCCLLSLLKSNSGASSFVQHCHNFISHLRS